MTQYQDRNTLKSYFQQGDFPSQEQFASLIDAFYHRSADQAPMNFIIGLTDALNGKASTESLAAMQVVLNSLNNEIEGLLNSSLITSYTHGQIAGRTLNGQLKPGRWYKITDFAQAHNLYDGSTGEIVANRVGATEALYVLATTPYTLAQNAISSSYPQDVIRYSLFGNEDTADIGYFDSLGNQVENYKGKIYYRHDTIKNVKAWYDFRNVKFRSWTINSPMWQSNSPYSVNDCAKDSDEKIYICRRNIQSTISPSSDNTGSWLLLYDLPSYQNISGNYVSWTKSVNDFCSVGSINPQTILIDSADFDDVNTFSTTNLSNIEIGRVDRAIVIVEGPYYTSLPNVVFRTEEPIKNLVIKDNSYNLRIVCDGEIQRSIICNCSNSIFTSALSDSEIHNSVSCVYQWIYLSKISESYQTIFPGNFECNEAKFGFNKVILPVDVFSTTFYSHLKNISCLDSQLLTADMTKFVVKNDNAEFAVQYTDSAGVQISPL